MRLKEYEVVKDKNLKTTEVAVMFVINAYVKINIWNKKGAYAVISQKLIGEGAGIKRGTVSRTVNSLENKGYLEINKEGHSRFIYSFPKDKCWLKGTVDEHIAVASGDMAAENETPPVQSGNTPLSGNDTGGCIKTEHIGYIDKDNIDKKVNIKNGAASALQNKPKKPSVSVGEEKTKEKLTVYNMWEVWDKSLRDSFPDIKFVPQFTVQEKGMMQDIIDKTSEHKPIDLNQ